MKANTGARLGRGSYFFYTCVESLLTLSAVMFLYTAHELMEGSKQVQLLLVILMIGAFAASFFGHIQLTIKRFHDLGKSGWYYLLMFVPLLNLYCSFVTIFRKGTTEDNDWGAPEAKDKFDEARRAFLVSACISLLAGTFFYGSLVQAEKKRLTDKPAEYEYSATKTLSAEEEAALAMVLQKPCDPDLSYKLGEIYINHGNYGRVEDLYEMFKSTCGEFMQLRWLAYHAAKQGGNFKQAERLVTTLIDEFPKDKDYRAWRGLLYEAHGFDDQAVLDFEKAIEFVPWLKNLPLNLVSAYERLGENCQALSELRRYAKLYPEILAESSIRSQNRRLLRACRRE